MAGVGRADRLDRAACDRQIRKNQKRRSPRDLGDPEKIGQGIPKEELTVLRSKLLHPGILQALAEAGHGSTVLISDGNFPHGTAPLPSARRVYLNLSPGKVLVTDVLDAIVPVVPIESAVLMASGSAVAPEAHAAIRSFLPEATPVEVIDRFAFYEATRSPNLALIIATADPRLCACVLLTIGVVDASGSMSTGA